MKVCSIALFLLVMVSSSSMAEDAKPTVLDVRRYGAVGDGQTLDTEAIQKAIDAARDAGRGTVLLTGGTFLSGTLELRSHVTLQVDRGAVLLGSPSRTHYRKNRWFALVLARGEEDVTIRGEGVIDGQGRRLAADVARMIAEGELADPMRSNRPSEDNRPQLIEISDCRKVRVQDITLKDSSCWVQTYNNCEDLALEHVTVRSNAYWNNDGLDIVDCRKVRVSRCDIDSADDGICLKSANYVRVCEDVSVEDCKVRSSANAFKIGTTSRGTFRRIKVRHLEIKDTFRSAVALECVDGGTIDGVDVSDVRATNTGNAVFIRLGDRHQDIPIGKLRNVVVSDLTVEVPQGRPDQGYPLPGPMPRERHNLFPSSITGLPGHPVVGVTLKRITIHFGGGGRSSRAWIPPNAISRVPERATRYPEFSMFGELPAWGFYCRHVEGMVLEDLKLSLKASDDRAVMVLDDVKDSKVQGLRASSYTSEPVILGSHIQNVEIHDSALIGSDRTQK